MEIGLVHYLTVGAVLFGLGMFTVMTRRNAVGILLGVELILNAAALNFVAFEHFGCVQQPWKRDQVRDSFGIGR